MCLAVPRDPCAVWAEERTTGRSTQPRGAQARARDGAVGGGRRSWNPAGDTTSRSARVGAVSLRKARTAAVLAVAFAAGGRRLRTGREVRRRDRVGRYEGRQSSLPSAPRPAGLVHAL